MLKFLEKLQFSGHANLLEFGSPLRTLNGWGQMLLWIKIDLVRIGTMRVQIKIWSVLDAILQMILYRVVIYSSLVEQRGRGKMCVWHFRHGMEGYLLYRNAISSLFAWFYAEDRLQLPSWPLNLARLWEEQVGRTILWPLGISFTSEVRNVLFCLYYDQSQIVTLTALIRNI